jgi:outer membrane protein OmpA-like peptidoglycan-associated protein
MRRHIITDEKEEPNFWPAVVDVFAGFLALLTLTALVTFSHSLRPTGAHPPPAKRDFIAAFRQEFGVPSTPESPQGPEVADLGFSEIKLYFPASFLFMPCHVVMKEPAAIVLGRLRALLGRYNNAIDRVQIAGHSDTDQPTSTGYCSQQGIRSNWELSARRAINVLELLAPADGSGLDPAKIWASALGEHHPATVGNDEAAKARNRRIEVIIRFSEHR